MARRAVAVAESRSTQAPSGLVTRSGKSANPCTCASRGGTRSRTDGRGGTGLPDTTSASGMVTGGPPSGRTTTTPSPQASQVPSRSVIAGPPLGPVSPRTSRRTTTADPHDVRPEQVPAASLPTSTL